MDKKKKGVGYEFTSKEPNFTKDISLCLFALVWGGGHDVIMITIKTDEFLTDTSTSLSVRFGIRHNVPLSCRGSKFTNAASNML